MPRGNETNVKVFHKGASEDFVVFVDDVEILEKWRNDKTIPLSDVLAGWKIFVTHKHGAQGVLDGASKSSLQNEFGTDKDEDVVVQILEKGEYQLSGSKGRQGDTNTRNGPTGGR